METFTHNFVVVDDDGTHNGVRTGAAKAAGGQLHSPLHVILLVC